MLCGTRVDGWRAKLRMRDHNLHCAYAMLDLLLVLQPRSNALITVKDVVAIPVYDEDKNVKTVLAADIAERLLEHIFQMLILLLVHQASEERGALVAFMKVFCAFVQRLQIN